MTKLTWMEENAVDHMSPEIWGPSLWQFLHTSSFSYPVQHPTPYQRKTTFQFINALSFMLPCSRCSHHMQTFIRESGFINSHCHHLDSRQSFSKWVFSFHQDVNERLGKNSSVKYSDLVTQYSQRRKSCTNSCEIAVPPSFEYDGGPRLHEHYLNASEPHPLYAVLLSLLVLTILLFTFLSVLKSKKTHRL